MPKRKSKFYLFLLLILLFVTFILFRMALAKIGDLRCEDINGCYSRAGCGEPGRVVGTCIIECESGAVITCPMI